VKRLLAALFVVSALMCLLMYRGGLPFGTSALLPLFASILLLLAMAREMPHARLLVYEGDDHFAYHNQVARFANAVDAFLQEVHPA